MEEFTVKLDRYVGPYTALLDLIEQKKLSITEIALVDVADEYIAYITKLDQKNMVDISQFIVVASTLMLMKAKSLLPGVTYTEGEEKQVKDLERKLEMYALLTGACNRVRKIYGVHQLHTRERVSYKGISVFVPDRRLTKEFLQSIAELTVLSFSKPQELVKIAVEQSIKVEQIIESMLERVRSMQAVSFKSLFHTTEKIAERKKLIIVNFIALLELLRMGTVQATQDIEGGDITIVKQEVDSSVLQ